MTLNWTENDSKTNELMGLESMRDHKLEFKAHEPVRYDADDIPNEACPPTLITFIQLRLLDHSRFINGSGEAYFISPQSFNDIII